MFGKNKSPLPLIPRFCPGCELDEFDEFQGTSCPECGETLLVKGFCPVCERHLRQEPGTLCPKHEVELEWGPPQEPAPIADGAYVSWVTVSVFPNSATAGILQGRLEAEGIPTFLEGQRMGATGMYLAATRGVRLQVPADRVDDARIILSQKWSLPVDETADFEDLL